MTEMDTNANDDKANYIRSAVDVIGEWSPLQKRLLTFYMIVYIISPFQNLGILFWAPKLKYWCKRPPGFENVTLDNECQSYEDTNKPCTEWEYDTSIFHSTIVSEWDLVCHRSWFSSIAASSYQVGYAVSAIFFGYLSDKYGRRFAMKIAIYMEIASGISQALSISIYHFLISRFFLGVSAYGRFFTGFLLIFECFGNKRRAPMSAFIELGWTVGYMLLPVMFYFIPHFRYLQLIVSVSEVLCLFWLRIVPESLRWQLTHGEFKEAERAMSEAAIAKGKISETELRRRLQLLEQHVNIEEQQLQEARKQTLLDLWKAPRLFRYCLVLYFTFFVHGFVYYGISLNVGDLGGNLFVNCFIFAVAELIANGLFYFIVNKFNRVVLLVTCIILSAICCFSIALLLWVNQMIALRVTIAMIFKICNTFSFHLIYVQSTEIIPTTLRQIGVGSCTASTRVGSVIAPFIREFSEATHPAVSMTLFGVLATIDAFLVFLLPETRNVEIPDTIYEASNIDRKQHNDSNSMIKIENIRSSNLGSPE